jgi:hypothetical protein
MLPYHHHHNIYHEDDHLFGQTEGMKVDNDSQIDIMMWFCVTSMTKRWMDDDGLAGWALFNSNLRLHCT